MKILISGAGIAGLTLAYWLQKKGHEIHLVEKFPALRQGGYMIDFWGTGYEVAEKMGLLEILSQKHYFIPELDFVNLKDQKQGCFKIQKMRQLLDYHHFNFLRSDLEKVLYQALPESAAIRFGLSIQEIHQTDQTVNVEFTDGQKENFDLVVGAEGLRSHLRRKLFGEDQKFEKFLGYYVASFTVPNTTNKKGFFKIYSLPEKQIWIYDLGSEKMSVTYIFKSQKEYARLSKEEIFLLLKNTFSSFGEVGESTLNLLHEAPDFYFDSISQIIMPQWSQGRIVLLGDSCQCVSLISGQGSALAMAAAYILAQELEKAGNNYRVAFDRYEKRMKPEISRKQKIAERFAASFIPKSWLGIYTRNLFVNLMFMPWISKYFIRKFALDQLKIDEK